MRQSIHACFSRVIKAARDGMTPFQEARFRNEFQEVADVGFASAYVPHLRDRIGDLMAALGRTQGEVLKNAGLHPPAVSTGLRNPAKKKGRDAIRDMLRQSEFAEVLKIVPVRELYVGAMECGARWVRYRVFGDARMSDIGQMEVGRIRDLHLHCLCVCAARAVSDPGDGRELWGNLPDDLRLEVDQQTFIRRVAPFFEHFLLWVDEANRHLRMVFTS